MIEMPFTGERYVPALGGQIKYEHLHRYCLALDWAKGKTVLDVASGEGYGAVILARVATRVVGVDLNSECARYATQRYQDRHNLTFAAGSCGELPLQDHSVDLVTSFETIEHHDRHQDMLNEIKRVLKPEGVLLLSSPNRPVYSEGPTPPNPYHVKELDWNELNELLTARFRSVVYYGQRLATGSVVFPLSTSARETGYAAYSNAGGKDDTGVPCLDAPMYYIAICGDQEPCVDQHRTTSVFLDRESDLWKEQQQIGHWANRIASELEEQRAQLVAATGELQRIKSSNGWRFICRAKESTNRIFPPYTKRRSIYDAGIRFLRWVVGERKSDGPAGRWLPVAGSIQKIRSLPTLIQKSYYVWRQQGAIVLAGKIRDRAQRLMGLSTRKRKQVYFFAKAWAPLTIQSSAQPLVSIVIPVHNHPLVTYTCLRSITEAGTAVRFEVIVVDDCSSDETPRMLSDISGIRGLRNETNQGFIGSCNAGAKIAQGQYVLFLNNDTIVQPHWLDELVQTFELVPNAGLVGAKLLYPDGSLQEAGSIVWNDGSAWNYGRFDDPDKPEYCYLREVDYCSGACILLPSDLFSQLGGFDDHYAPAYGEDSDLAFKVRQAGKTVLYQPKAEIIHFEGTSSGRKVSQGIKKYQVVNKEKLFHRWASVLVGHAAPGERPELERERAVTKRILVVDACTPTPDQDAGSLKIFNFIKIFQSLSYQVTFIADDLTFIEHYTKDLQRRGVHCLYWPYVTTLDEHLAREGAKYDLILSCRPDVTEKHLASYRKHCPSAKVLYDTADIHYLREQRQAEIEGNTQLAKQAERRKAQELGLVAQVDCTIVVSEREKAILQNEVPRAKLSVISAVHDRYARSVAFEDTHDILFLGGYQHLPNVDAVQYFVTDVFPILRDELPGVKFYIVGSRPPESVQRLACDDVIVTGYVPNLEELMAHCRLSVNPLRYGAGIKGKIVSCMAYGVPCAGTSVAFEGMELEDGRDVVIADTAKDLAAGIAKLYQDKNLWQTLSDRGYTIVRDRYSFESAHKCYADLFDSFRIPARTHHLPATYYGVCNVCGEQTHFKTLGSDNLRESLLCEICGASCRNRSLAGGLLHLAGSGQVRSIAELAAAPSGPVIFDTDGFSPLFKFLKEAEFYTSS
ncbi:MAG: glycosyltransferase, partial [Nitrospira sp.]